MEEYESEPTNKSSKINSAMIINVTLNSLLENFFKEIKQGKYLSANNDLDCIWVILGGEPHIKDSDIEKQFIRINSDLILTGTLSDSIQSRGFNSISNEIIIKLNKQKRILFDKALFLQRLRNSQGKGSAYDDGDEDDFD